MLIDKAKVSFTSSITTYDFDYLIKARIPEMTEYRRLLGEILHLADSAQSKSYVVMEEVKETLALSISN